jgi:hypothetical protein
VGGCSWYRTFLQWVLIIKHVNSSLKIQIKGQFRTILQLFFEHMPVHIFKYIGPDSRALDIEFIADSLHGRDAVYPEFLSDLPDMHIDGAVTDYDVRSPDLSEDLVPEENPAGP